MSIIRDILNRINEISLSGISPEAKTIVTELIKKWKSKEIKTKIVKAMYVVTEGFMTFSDMNGKVVADTTVKDRGTPIELAKFMNIDLVNNYDGELETVYKRRNG